MTSTEAPFSVGQTSGDFADFYAASREPIGRMLSMTLNDSALGFEAVDEAMTRAYQRWSSIDGHANPEGWVYRVGLNWARSWQRRLSTAARKRPEVTNLEHLRSQVFAAGSEPGLEDAELTTALASLPDHHRAVVVLRFHLDWSVDEVADVLGISPGTVKSRVHRALTALRSELGPEATGDGTGVPDEHDDRRRRATTPAALLPLPDRLRAHLHRTAESIDAPAPAVDPTEAGRPARGRVPGVLTILLALLLLAVAASALARMAGTSGPVDFASNLLPDALGGGSDNLPILEQAVWDGTQFVMNDNSWVDDELVSHWTSPDGLEWTRHDGPAMAGWEWRCYPGFPCDIEPQDPEDIPYHFTRPAQSVTAIRDDGRGGLALVKAWNQYVPFVALYDEHGDELPGGGSIHPQVAEAASTHSECFAEAMKAWPEFSLEPGVPSITQWGLGLAEQWTITMGCERDGRTEKFELVLDDKLTDQQLHWLAAGSDRQLFAVQQQGEVGRVVDPPTVSYWSDGIVGGEMVTTLPEIAATSTRFWAPDEGTLVSSVDGLRWETVGVPLGGGQVDAVAASLAGDIALLVVDDQSVGGDGPKRVILSHDDGRTWSEPIAVGEEQDWVAQVVGVSSAGAVVETSGLDGDAFHLVSHLPPVANLDVTFEPQPGARWAALGSDQILVPDQLDDADGNPNGDWVLKVYNTSGQLVDTITD